MENLGQKANPIVRENQRTNQSGKPKAKHLAPPRTKQKENPEILTKNKRTKHIAKRKANLE